MRSFCKWVIALGLALPSLNALAVEEGASDQAAAAVEGQDEIMSDESTSHDEFDRYDHRRRARVDCVAKNLRGQRWYARGVVRSYLDHDGYEVLDSYDVQRIRDRALSQCYVVCTSHCYRTDRRFP